ASGATSSRRAPCYCSPAAPTSSTTGSPPAGCSCDAVRAVAQKEEQMKRSAFLALTAATLAGTGCHQIGGLLNRPGVPAPGIRPLEDIRSIDDLRTRFHAD